jgi:hypothetical protein
MQVYYLLLQFCEYTYIVIHQNKNHPDQTDQKLNRSVCSSSEFFLE